MSHREFIDFKMVERDGIEQFLISQFNEQVNVPTVLKTSFYLFFNG